MALFEVPLKLITAREDLATSVRMTAEGQSAVVVDCVRLARVQLGFGAQWLTAFGHWASQVRVGV